MLLLILLAILAIIALGVGFVAHWLFIVAAVLALIWLISLFTGGFGTGAPASEVDLVGALGLRSCSAKHKDCSCGATRSWVVFL